MPTGERPNRPKARRPSKETFPADLEVAPGQMAVPMRVALSALKRVADRDAGVTNLIDRLGDHDAGGPRAYALLPATLASFLGCDDTSGSPSATIVLADVAVTAGTVLVSFTYTLTSATGCEVRDVSEITLTNTTTGTGAQPLSKGALGELERSLIPATAPAQHRWIGKQTAIGATGGAINVGDTVLITATFPVKVTKYCHTCTPNPVVITASVTVK